MSSERQEGKGFRRNTISGVKARNHDFCFTGALLCASESPGLTGFCNRYSWPDFQFLTSLMRAFLAAAWAEIPPVGRIWRLGSQGPAGCATGSACDSACGAFHWCMGSAQVCSAKTGSNSKKQERQEEQSRPTKITLGLFTPYFCIAAVKIS